MRNHLRNKREMWYAVLKDEANAIGPDGYYTGETIPEYDTPTSFKASLSATRGTQGFTGTGATFDFFGQDLDYALIISTADMSLPINEGTLIWVRNRPVKDAEGHYDYSTADYRVTAVAIGLYHMKYAIRMVKESRGGVVNDAASL